MLVVAPGDSETAFARLSNLLPKQTRKVGSTIPAFCSPLCLCSYCDGIYLIWHTLLFWRVFSALILCYCSGGR